MGIQPNFFVLSRRLIQLKEPYVANFMLSDETREVVNPSRNRPDLLLINPTSSIRVPFIPATPSFAVSVGILQINLEEENNIQIKLVSPNEKTVFDTGIVPIPRDLNSNKDIPLEGQGFNVNLNLQNVPCREEGTYVVDVYINGLKSNGFKFYVYSEER